MASARRQGLLESGVRNLDIVLGGGIVPGDTLLIVGPPGSGKTTLAFQLAFQAASSGGKALYASTYSESAARFVKHLKGFSFWDQRLLGKSLFLESLSPVIKRSVSEIVEVLVEAVKERGATLLVIDGFMTLRDVHGDVVEVRTFVDDLAAALTPLGCTTVITSSHVPERRGSTPPEFTMCDAVLELGRRDRPSHTSRVIDVWKVRGAPNELGEHSFQIDGDGLVIFPRTEVMPMPPTRASEEDRLSFGSFGAPELDKMASGGLPRGSVTLIAGAPGTGKTLLGLQYLLDGAARGERGIWVGFRESEVELIAKAKSFGRDLERCIEDGTLRLVHRSPVDLDADEFLLALWADVEEHGAVRLAVDSVAELLEALPEGRHRSAMTSFSERVRGNAMTAVLTRELSQVVGPELDFADSPLEVLAENLLLLRYVEFQGQLSRIISILKMRDTAHDRSIRQYEIESGYGLRVLEKMQSDGGVLSGIARQGSQGSAAGNSPEEGDA